MRDIKLTEKEATTLLRACEILRDKLGVEVAPAKKKPDLRPKDKETLAAFWEAYPQVGRERSSKVDVAKKWNALKIKPSPEILMDALAKWKQSEKWLEGYVNGADKFLSKQLWESAPEAVNVVKINRAC